MSKKYTKKLLSYSAVAGAFVAVGQTADAQVVYTNVEPDSVVSIFTGPGSMDIDLDNDGNVDFQIRHDVSYSIYTSTSSSTTYTYFLAYRYANIFKVASGAEVFGVNTSQVDTLPTDEELIDTDVFNVQNNNYNLASYYSGSFGTGSWGPLPGEGDRYVGVRFMIGTDTHYGWIRLNVPAGVNQVNVLEYAYETQPGVGIHGGDTIGVYIAGLVPSNILATSAQIDYTPMKGGSVYMVVQNYADPVPTETEVISGAGAAGATLIHADTNLAVAETGDNFAISSLSTFTQYKAYLVLVDDSNIVSNVIDTAFTTLDPTGIDFNGITEFKIFPNPVVQNLNMELPEASRVIIRDISGREVMLVEVEAGRQQLDLSMLESGTYMIEAIAEHSSKTLKFIKK